MRHTHFQSRIPSGLPPGLPALETQVQAPQRIPDDGFLAGAGPRRRGRIILFFIFLKSALGSLGEGNSRT